MTTRLIVVGAGPRAFMLVERIVARLPSPATGGEVGAPDLEIDLFDPHPAGAGRIWRRAQSPLLKLNSMAQDVTVFTDESCTIEGPIAPGPSLIAWAQSWRQGELPGIEIDDELAAAEARGLRPDSFPTRRLHSFYLDWFAQRVIASAPAGVAIRVHADTVAAVRASADPCGDGPHSVGPSGAAWTVALASGTERDADVVVYALGHNGRTPDAATAGLTAGAHREGLIYVGPDFTADADLTGIPEEGDVIVRGMGLAAVDLVVLLTQGRGGRFVETPATTGRPAGLRYLPSGREPRLHLGSRRGVPYRSKVSSTIQGEPPRRDVLTPEAIAALLARPEPLDFERDTWPLIAAELLHGHYRELFTGHPERVTGTWPEAKALLQTHAWDDPRLRAALDARVPDPLDRFDVAALDRPLARASFASRDAAHEAVRAHIIDDLELRTSQDRSPAQGVFFAALLSFLALSEIPAARWNARSRAESLPGRWHTFFSYVASGPPAHRLHELLALADAGIVRFLGPDVDVRIAAGAGFEASSPRTAGTTAARTLVDAWLPGTGAAESDNPALRQLATELGAELRVRDDDFDGGIGRVLVDLEGRVIAPGDAPHESLFALGPFTSQPEGGAFTRPGIDALSFRQTDRIAAAVTARLGLPVALPS